jgi:hypothetical protein
MRLFKGKTMKLSITDTIFDDFSEADLIRYYCGGRVSTALLDSGNREIQLS